MLCLHVVIQINDVYKLDNFPNLVYLGRRKKQGPDQTLVILAG
jgi:hypothetical protein